MTPTNDPSNEDYTVGWICAIHPEAVAAFVCLDEFHGTPNHVASENDTYFQLGKIGKHNVVIACLPEGVYGLASAAGVVKDMLHSFKNVKVCLMVGIAGGAPTKDKDIRLGDIVVSVPGNNHGGVCQHDFGKRVQNQDFQQTGFLNKPAQILLGAVSGLKLMYKVRRNQPETAINLIIQRQDKELQDELQRPSQDSDRLFLSHVTCPSPGSRRCEGTSPVDQSDQSDLVERAPRPRPQCPIVHRGLIASGSELVKDADYRDRLANEKGILCFEMEAAGLMNNFPCLVIRGICDYSDTHKNKKWQQYAALAAAVYARDLLNQIAPTLVDQQPPIEQVLKKLSNVEQGINKMNEAQQIQVDKAMLQWITTVDYGPQYSKLRDLTVDDTGQWLLKSKKYNTWLQSTRQTLFCTGMPGSGKTFLATKVISHLREKCEEDSSIGIAYIYCQYKREDQKIQGLLASLLKQLTARSPLPEDYLKQLYESNQAEKTTLTLHEILQSLRLVAAKFSRVFIVIDALDECEGEDASVTDLVEYILKDLQVQTATNFFATSRGLPNIQELFSDFPRLEISAKEDDIERYVDAHMGKLPIFRCKQEYPDLRRSIKNGISRAVEGMFLLAKFYLELLKYKYNAADMYDALAKLEKPSSLGANEDQGRLTYKKMYDELMNRIKGEPFAMQILSWITYAKRQLSIKELQVALAVRDDDEKLDKDRETHINIIVQVCAGLIEFDEQSEIVRLVHYTLDEYFEQTKKDFFPNADIDIFRFCRSYLSFKDFEKGPCREPNDYESRLQRPLYRYAARNWGYHAQSVSADDMVLAVLENENMMALSSQVITDSGEHGFRHPDTTRLGPFILASIFSLTGAMTLLLRDKPDLLEEEDSCRGWTPLMWAVHSRQKTAVEVLLERGADFKVKTLSGRTPLSRAAFHSDTYDWPSHADKNESALAVAWLLLGYKKVDIRAEVKASQTPLMWAAGYGHFGIARLLINNDNNFVDLDTRDADGRTALSWAAGNGHESLVRLLLATQRVNPDSRDNGNRSPLFWAVMSFTPLAEMRERARLESNPNEIPSRLEANRIKHLERFRERFIRRCKQKYDFSDSDLSRLVHSWPPYQWSTEESFITRWTRERHTILQLLLERNVAVNLEENKTGRTPLMLAAEVGEHAVVQMLTNKGADMGSVNEHGRLLSLADQNDEEQLTEFSRVWSAPSGLWKDLSDTEE